jgi:hypothetical protein
MRLRKCSRSKSYFDQSLTVAAINAGIVLGVTGLVGLLIGGALADRAARSSLSGRLRVGAWGLTAAVPLTAAALRLGPDRAVLFVLLFSIGWLGQLFFHVAAYPAASDVIEPRLRATAIAVFFGAF